MAYYTAVLARSGERWQLTPSDLDAPEDLAEVADQVRQASRGGAGLAIVEREDEWFAIVRVDGEEDPRIFVSDLAAARRGPFAVLFEDIEEWERPVAVEVGAGPAATAGVQDATGGSGGSRADVADDLQVHPGAEELDEELDDEVEDDEDDEDDDAADEDDDADDDDEDDADDDDEDEDDADAEDDADLVAEARPSTGDRPDTALGGLGRGEVESGALVPAPLEEVMWAGDLGLLEDYGLEPDVLRAIVDAAGSDPSAALLAIGERAGFGDVIDEWH